MIVHTDSFDMQLAIRLPQLDFVFFLTDINSPTTLAARLVGNFDIQRQTFARA